MPDECFARLTSQRRAASVVFAPAHRGQTPVFTSEHRGLTPGAKSLKFGGWVAAERLPEILAVHPAADVDGIAHQNGITSTPTFLVGKTGAVGSRVDMQSPTDVKSLERAIARALPKR